MISANSQVDANLPSAPGPESPILDAIREFLRDTDHFLITSHARPDGDAVGSVLAMGAALRQMGKQVDLVLADPVPQVYHTLPGVHGIRHTKSLQGHDYGAAVILECDSTDRTGLQGYGEVPIINIDHHITGSNFGDLNWIDRDACAVAAMVYRLALAMGAQVTPEMATCLYTAVLTDTGAFTFPGTSASSFTLAQELISLGANADTVARDVLYSVSAARLRLLGIALSRLQIHGVVAWSFVTQEDLAKLNATDEDTEGAVNYLVSIAGVEAALFLRELPREEGQKLQYRTSLRSKSSIDVSVIASICGGGGHRNAAGCVLTGPLDSTVSRLLIEVEREVKRALFNATSCGVQPVA